MAWIKKVISLILPRGQFARSVAVLAGGTAVGQAIGVLVSPILTRLYTPQDFGVLGIYTSILGILSVIASLRYELAIPLPTRDEDAVNLLALSICVVVFMGLLVGFGTWLLKAYIVRWANLSVLRPYLWLLPIGVIMVGAYQALNYWAVRKKAFTQIARTKLAQGAGLAVTQVGIGLLKSGPLGLLIGRIVGQAAGISTFAWLLYKQDKNVVTAISPRQMVNMGVRYRRFPLFSGASALINALGLQLPLLLLSGFYGTHVAGQFMLAQRVFGLPISLLGTAISQVYLSQAAQQARTDIRELQRLSLSLAKKLVIYGAIPTFILIAIGPSLFALVFGAEWREAGRYTQIMGFMFLCQFVFLPLSYSFSVMERQDLSLIWTIFRLILSTGTIYLVYRAGGSDIYAVVAYSLGMSIAYLGFFPLFIHAVRHYAQKG